MTGVEDAEVIEGRAYRWVVGVLYTSLLAANLYLVFDWWRDTAEGQATIARLRGQFEELRRRAQECEGCARRKARLQAAVNRMHWEAEQIVTDPDPQP